MTGGGSGLGRAGAVALAAAGANVYVTGRSKARLQETTELIESMGHRARALEMDVTSAESVERSFEVIAGETDDLAVLVNNAGVAYEARLVEADPTEMQRVLDTNLMGVLLASRAFARRCNTALGPSIINISSLAGRAGVKGQVSYAASKGGVDAATRSLALELARHGIRVNAIAPGYFDTDMPAAVTADQKLLAALLRKIPLRRLGNPEEIGPPRVFGVGVPDRRSHPSRRRLYSTMTRFSGAVAVVTGAAGDIGRQTAIRFAEEGARVAVTDRSDDLLARGGGPVRVRQRVARAMGEGAGTVIVGGGQAGFHAARALRARGYERPIRLVCE